MVVVNIQSILQRTGIGVVDVLCYGTKALPNTMSTLDKILNTAPLPMWGIQNYHPICYLDVGFTEAGNGLPVVRMPNVLLLAGNSTLFPLHHYFQNVTGVTTFVPAAHSVRAGYAQ